MNLMETHPIVAIVILVIVFGFLVILNLGENNENL